MRCTTSGEVELFEVVGHSSPPCDRFRYQARILRFRWGLQLNDTKVNREPFPALIWSDSDENPCWQGSDVLVAWDALQATSPANVHGSDNPAEFYLTVASIDPSNKKLPTAEQICAYRFLKENDTRIVEAILSAAFEEYDWLREDCEEVLSPEDFARLTPDVTSPRDLLPLMALATVTVLTESKDGCAYMGVALSCTWDDEHGVGVMTHRGRIVSFGQYDTSFIFRGDR